MPLQVALLEQSFASVAPQGERIADVFYQQLFNDYPEVQPLFANANMAEQKRKLLSSLQLVIENLRRPDTLVPALEKLGLRHIDYGTQESHYPAVGETLLSTLAEVAGDAWNDELDDAWSEAYEEIVGIMLNGAAQPAS